LTKMTAYLIKGEKCRINTPDVGGGKKKSVLMG
jgi:hypothetical protein